MVRKKIFEVHISLFHHRRDRRHDGDVADAYTRSASLLQLNPFSGLPGPRSGNDDQKSPERVIVGVPR